MIRSSEGSNKIDFERELESELEMQSSIKHEQREPPPPYFPSTHKSLSASHQTHQSQSQKPNHNHYHHQQHGDKEEQEQQQQQPHQQQQQQQQQQQRENEDQRGDSNKPKRNPFCSRCRNHGKFAMVRGHKRHCAYRECLCNGCELVKKRQAVSAAQIKLRREQKQDEECGRQIEVSPPVLSREPHDSGDQSTLITKALIGPVSRQADRHRLQPYHHRQHQHQQADQKQQLVGGGRSTGNLSQQSNQIQSHLPAIHPTASLAAVAAAAINSQASSASSLSPNPIHNLQLNHHLNGHHHSQIMRHRHNNADSSSGSSYTSGAGNSTCGNSNNMNGIGHQSENIYGGHLTGMVGSVSPLQNPTVGCGESRSPVNPSLQNALHLFHFPNYFLSAAAVASLGSPHSSPANLGGSGFPPGAANGSVLPGQSQLASSSPLPSINEQITLVEEIHEAFGPLAIFAWLKSIQFDLQKVHDLIEFSRVSFDELLQIRRHSPLDLTSPIVD